MNNMDEPAEVKKDNDYTSCKLEFRNGRPVFVVNGEPISYAAYQDMAASKSWFSPPKNWTERIKEFIDSDVHVFSIQPEYAADGHWGNSPFWTDDGIYPDVDPEKYFCVDKQAKAVIDMDAEAWIVVRFGDFTPQNWVKANPGHMQKTWNGKDVGNQISLASSKGMNDLLKFMEAIVSYCESRPWSDRVIGYLYYPYGEGVTNLNTKGFVFDQCDEMQKSFKEWVRRNYCDEAKLREAWEDENITFDSVTVPIDPEWATDREKAFHWIEDNQLRKMRDYMLLQRELFIHWYKSIIENIRGVLAHRQILFGIDMAKQTMLGWQIQLFFDGIGSNAEFPNIIYASGGIDVGELLDEPGLDIITTPADYTARTVGYGWESEGIADSMRLRGKTIYVENDCRTFEEMEIYTLGAFKTIKELRAGMLRNAAWSLTRGHIDYWATPYTPYFNIPEVQEHGIRAATPLLDIAPSCPHIETENAIAMIIDDTSPIYEDGTAGYQNLAVIWQRVIGLAHCGIPYRVYLFSDLARENMLDYRCYLFPNLFMIDESRHEILRKKIFKDGRMAIFGPATGITDGVKLSAEWATRVLGVEMEMIRRHSPRRVIVNGSTPITRELPASMIYGDSQAYGPIIIPAKGAIERAGGVVLGEATTYWGINRPGLFVKDFDGGYKIAWSVAVPLPGNLLRVLARYGGCHVWCEDDDVILASDTVAAVHSIKAGQRTLKFPSARNVWDMLSGEKIGSGLKEITVDMNPPETKIFYLGKNFPK